MLIKAITTASLALLSLLLVHWHEELKLLSRDHNFKYDEIFTVPPGGSVFLSHFFSEMVNTDFHNQVTRIDNERASPTYTPLFMDRRILRTQVHDAC